MLQRSILIGLRPEFRNVIMCTSEPSNGICHCAFMLILPLGTAGGMYAAGVCTAARFRDKDDFVNASIGGALAGTVFGFKCKYRRSYCIDVVIPSNVISNPGCVQIVKSPWVC